MNYYELRIREFVENDINHDCKFMPDHSCFEMCFGALVEDISALGEIDKAENRNNYISIASQMEQQQILTILEPYFTKYFCNLRYESIKKV